MRRKKIPALSLGCQLSCPLPSPLAESPALLQGLQKPRSILKCGFSISKAIKSNPLLVECKLHSPAEGSCRVELAQLGASSFLLPPCLLPNPSGSGGGGEGRSIPRQKRGIPIQSWPRALSKQRMTEPSPAPDPAPHPRIPSRTKSQL